jgi:hypothetical protein
MCLFLILQSRSPERYDLLMSACTTCFAAASSALFAVVLAKRVRGLTLYNRGLCQLPHYDNFIFNGATDLLTWRFLNAASFAVAGDMMLSEGETYVCWFLNNERIL